MMVNQGNVELSDGQMILFSITSLSANCLKCVLSFYAEDIRYIYIYIICILNIVCCEMFNTYNLQHILHFCLTFQEFFV